MPFIVSVSRLCLLIAVHFSFKRGCVSRVYSLKLADPSIELFEKFFDCIKLSSVLSAVDCKFVLKLVRFADELIGFGLVEE